MRIGRRGIVLVLGALLYASSFWAWSGTLAPYAATVPGTTASAEILGCRYPVSVDHGHFKAVFDFLDGQPRDTWAWSVVLRRMLHPLVAYPFFKGLGFELGGIIFNFLIGAIAIVIFAREVGRTIGPVAWAAALLMLSGYPGFFYWGTLPYSYGACVPVFLFVFLLLTRMDVAFFSGVRAWSWALAIGLCNVAYDVFPYVIPAILLIAWRRGKFRESWRAIVAVLLPLMVVLLFYGLFFRVRPGNSNTASYGNILTSYFQVFSHWREWVLLILQSPLVLIRNFLDSNFLFIPLLCALTFFVLRSGGTRFSMIPCANTVSSYWLGVLLVWSIGNLAPPYSGWQMRGFWVARLYQPLIAGMVWVSALGMEQLWIRGKRVIATVALCSAVVGNLWVIWGPWWGSQFASDTIYRFYAHLENNSVFDGREVKSGKMPEPGTSPYYENLARTGRHPLGVCAK